MSQYGGVMLSTVLHVPYAQLSARGVKGFNDVLHLAEVLLQLHVFVSCQMALLVFFCSYWWLVLLKNNTSFWKKTLQFQWLKAFLFSQYMLTCVAAVTDCVRFNTGVHFVGDVIVQKKTRGEPGLWLCGLLYSKWQNDLKFSEWWVFSFSLVWSFITNCQQFCTIISA